MIVDPRHAEAIPRRDRAGVYVLLRFDYGSTTAFPLAPEVARRLRDELTQALAAVDDPATIPVPPPKGAP